MIKTKVIFIVLTYRNTKDLEDFIKSAKKCVKDYKVIVVNSFYDKESSLAFREISERNNCDFVEVENKGYSYGNNRGIDYATEHYLFDYLVVSNPDICIENFDIASLDQLSPGIYGGSIINKRGKCQNPMVIRERKWVQRLIYFGFKKNNNLLLYSGILANKISRLFFNLNHQNKKSVSTVYQLHGSFIIFHQEIIHRWKRVFDENIFLFAEESCLAKRAEKDSIFMYYIPTIRLLHKEDGSMIFIGKKANDRLREANIYFYEKYCIEE